MKAEDKSLNKYISETGICSRREADKWIESGRVRLNGEVAVRGNRVAHGDTVTLDGKPLQNKTESVYIVLNKPAGITCTTDTKDKSNIIDFIKHPSRIFPIGRLDKPSTGLIILTSDGDIVNEILRVENDHEKEYVVSVDKIITDEFLQRMSDGIPILGTLTKKCEIRRESARVFTIILKQGLNRQIRRMCEFLDYKVINLKRIRIINIHLGNLKSGQWRNLSSSELYELKKHVGITSPKVN